MCQSFCKRNYRNVSNTMAAITEPITLEASIQNTDQMRQMENNNYHSQEYE